jgi:predicted nucleic acid-binding protein
MKDSRLVCVVDSSTFINFHRGGLLEEFFRLPFHFIAPDVIVEELEEPKGQMMVELGLESMGFAPELIFEVEKAKSKYRRPGTNDIFALILARETNSTLLTDDGALREAAKQEKVRFHGTLWVLDELLESDIIDPLKAGEALKEILQKGGRLPFPECQKRLKKWEAK